MSVVTRCQACLASDEAEDGIPRCQHFRWNLELGYVGMPIGRFAAWFVRRGLQPPWWLRGVPHIWKVTDAEPAEPVEAASP